MVELNKEVAAGKEEVVTPKPTLQGLFVNREQAQVTGGVNQLANTAKLTSLATGIADTVSRIINADPEKYHAMVEGSLKDHNIMDDLIMMTTENLANVDYSFLKGTSTDEFDRMIRSQQSKRSRAKSKDMTFENYHSMLVGAVAENLLRFASNQPKSAGGSSGSTTVVTLEKAQAMTEDDLKKAVRNVQSKKSIMKGKAGYSETQPSWLALLEEEAMLKSVRDNVAPVVTEEAKKALEVAETLKDQMSTVDLENMSEEEKTKLLAAMQQILASN